MKRDGFSNYVPGLYFSAHSGFKSVENDWCSFSILTKVLGSPVDHV